MSVVIDGTQGVVVSGNTNTLSGITVGRGAGNVSTNTVLGSGAGQANTTGSGEVFIGYQAGANNTTGTNNTAVGGYQTFVANTTGSFNTAIGQQALQANTTASNNTAVGYQAGYAVTTGASNTLLGYTAGNNITTGAGNLLLGYGTTVSSAADNFEIVLGFNIVGKGTSTGFINPQGGAVYQGNNSTLWSITSDQRIKKNIVNNDTGLKVINQIQVRNFEYRLPEEITDLPQEQAVSKQGVQLGVIAQELQQVLPECVKTESTGVMTVNADNLTWYLVNAVKELTTRIKQLEEN